MNGEQHQVGFILLFDFTVNFQHQLNFVWVWDFSLAMNLDTGKKVSNPLPIDQGNPFFWLHPERFLLSYQ